jgi:hypothetical protein
MLGGIYDFQVTDRKEGHIQWSQSVDPTCHLERDPSLPTWCANCGRGWGRNDNMDFKQGGIKKTGCSFYFLISKSP